MAVAVIQVPNVAGLPVDNARQVLDRAGISYSVSERATTSAAPGTIVDQSPAPGTAPTGTLHLTVAKAPRGGIATTPGLAAIGAGSAAAAAAAGLIAGLLASMRARSDDDYVFLMDQLQRRYPDRPQTELRDLARLEQTYEAEYQAKVAERLRVDLPKALAIADPEKRRAAVQGIMDREKRFRQQREEAMVARAMARADQLYLRDSSPEGAYWVLSPYVKEHTLDCLAMAGRFWPWEVLRVEGPPRHFGCPCYLLGKAEAIALGYMTEADVPDPSDALRRARKALSDIQEARDLGLTEVLERGVVAVLEEAPARWASGTEKGGEFRPRRGGDAGRALLRALPNGARRRVEAHVGRGPRYATIRGRTVRIPQQHWERSIDGVKFTSPAGGTNVYREGRLAGEAGAPPVHRDLLPSSQASPAPAINLDSPRMRELGQLVSQARAELRGPAAARAATAAASGESPVRVGDGPEAIPAARAAGFAPISGRGRDLTLRSPAGSLSMTLGNDHVEKADFDPHGTVQPRAALRRAPQTFAEHASDALAWADEIGSRHGATVQVPAFKATSALADHAGNHEWDGVVRVGQQAADDIDRAAAARREGRPLTDDEARGQYAAYWVTAHEIAHGINPTSPELYQGGDAALEEALTEEISHDLALQRLHDQGQGDVVRWALASPDALPVRGSYLAERGALGGLLDQAKITDPQDRLEFVRRLKFEVPPESRMRALADEVAKGTGMGTDAALDHVELTLDHSADHTSAGPIVAPAELGRGKASPGTVATIPDYSGLELKLGKPAGGSNGARWAEGPAGEKWLVKTYRGNENRVATELLSNAIYREMGARAPVAGSANMAAPPDFTQIRDRGVGEPPMPKAAPGEKPLRVSTGMVVREPDGRLWVYEPKGHFGGYEHTYPKGMLEPGLSPQQNAHKELWEETGLHARITGYVGDFPGTTGVTRYYVAVRTGGEPHPDDPTPYEPGGSETAAVKLLTPEQAAQALNTDRDQKVLAAALNLPIPTSAPPDDFPPEVQRALTYPALDGEVREHYFDKNPPSAELGRHFMTDALLANWDFVGLEDDNILWDADGRPIRLDQGGTLEYRAQGAKKPFGPVPTEVWTMLGPKGQGFGTVVVSDADKREQAARIAQTLTPERIDALVDQAGFPDGDLRARVRRNLKARVEWMDRYAHGEESIPGPLRGADARAALADAMEGVPLDPDEEWAIAAFQEDPDAVNAHLRSGAPKHEASEDVQDIVSLLDGAAGSTKAPEDVVAYVAIPSNGDQGLVGRTLRDPGFLSATTDEARVDDAPATLRVTIPQGAPLLYAPDGEPQVIMRRNTSMKIVGRSTENGRDYLDAVTVPPVWGTKPLASAITEAWTTTELLEAAAGNTGAMVALYPSPALARALAVEGGEDVDELHVTLAFLGKAAQLDGDRLKQVVQGFASSCPPLAGVISGIGQFVGGDTPVTYASVDLPGLPSARERLVQALDGAGMPAARDHGFTPHITLAYDDRRVDPVERKARFDAVTLKLGDERFDYRLTGEEAKP